MKYFYIIFFLSITELFSQKIEKRIGDFKITISTYRFEDSKKKNKIGKEEIYFDSSGKTLEKIKYGRHHYNKLNVIGTIEQFQYENEQLIFSKKYISSCKSCQFDEFFTKYKYNNEELISETNYVKKDNSILKSFEYKRNDKSTEIHSGQSTYIQKIYDDNSKLIELNQVFEDSNKIRWQYLYKYGENWKEANFQTYFGDGKENSKREVETFDSQNRIITKEIISSYNTKLLFTYSKNGIINEIKEYNSYSNGEYKLEYSIKYNFKGKTRKLNSEVLSKLNAVLIER
jgi:hypothetical protein